MMITAPLKADNISSILTSLNLRMNVILEHCRGVNKPVKGRNGYELTDVSCLKVVVASPKAQSTPGLGGTMTSLECSKRPSAQACMGPAPPNATKAKSRGSYPLSILTTRSAPSMLSFASRSMPSAASMRPMPKASATVITAFLAASMSSLKSPPSKVLGK